jgi:hypothetical protein
VRVSLLWVGGFRLVESGDALEEVRFWELQSLMTSKLLNRSLFLYEHLVLCGNNRFHLIRHRWDRNRDVGHLDFTQSLKNPTSSSPQYVAPRTPSLTPLSQGAVSAPTPTPATTATLLSPTFRPTTRLSVKHTP